MSDKGNDEAKKLKVYAIMATAATPEVIDLQAISEETGVKVQSLANYKGNLVSGNYGYRYLRGNKWGDEQIAPWVSRHKKGDDTPTITPTTPRGQVKRSTIRYQATR